MAPYRVVLADDHAMFREGLKRILSEKAALEIVGEAEDGLQLLALVKRAVPDLIILDISMPNLRGIEAIHEIKVLDRNVKILVLTMHNDQDYLQQAIAVGADGYLLKEDAHNELFCAIDIIRGGRIFISPRLAEWLTADWARLHRVGTKTPMATPQPTPREREVLKLIAEGRTHREIAELLSISARTVDHHRANIMGKLNFKKVADLVKYAIQNGYL